MLPCCGTLKGNMKIKTKSPIIDKPLRYVAQSGDEALENLLFDKVLAYYVTAVICSLVCAFEWIRYFQPRTNRPLLSSVLLVFVCIVCSYKIFKHIKKVKALKQGRDGERAVGQYLELFREEGCHIYHDILGDSFNVDHVVISTKGVFVIETKTYSKPINGSAKITFDNGQILINGRESLSDIVTQVKAATSFVEKILIESTGKKLDAFPVVLFPGWYIEGRGNRQGKMWVLEPKAFRKFINARPDKLSPEDVRLASYHLSRFIRTT